MKRLRLLIVDDQSMFREGLRTLLTRQPDFEIVGEASDGKEAVRLATEVCPDIILMDLRMPIMSGAEATRQLLGKGLGCRVIALTTFDDDEEVFAALCAGAVGYLLKASPIGKVCEAIRLTAQGESFLEPSVAAKVVSEFARLAGQKASRAPAPLIEPLSDREIEVVRLLAVGKSNKEIGAQLRIAEGTVKNHMSNILAKFGVLDRTQAALRARDLGLI